MDHLQLPFGNRINSELGAVGRQCVTVATAQIMSEIQANIIHKQSMMMALTDSIGCDGNSRHRFGYHNIKPLKSMKSSFV
ncbi:unnamed protein product [Ceratitis capitata]|uniref:(Mediterranean fruit fly) hypothetical protein n=1 Tax=Ceratitis capitata TaxID=7213 RepID=A0A811V3S2_CERCA|nr:unnamed protein product [Ceratitis capitata]